MTEAKTVEAVLAKLQAPSRTKSETWTKIKSNLGPIFAARDRRVPWKTIAEALGEAGIHVHHESLRLFMNNQERDLTKYPKTTPLPKKRRRVKRRVSTRQTAGARKAATQGQTEAMAEKQNRVLIQATNERTKRAAATPPEPPADGKFLKIEGPL
jgi:hypothetical protein